MYNNDWSLQNGKLKNGPVTTPFIGSVVSKSDEASCFTCCGKFEIVR